MNKSSIVQLFVCLNLVTPLLCQARWVVTLDSTAPFDGTLSSGPIQRREEDFPENNAAAAFYEARSRLDSYKELREMLLEEEQLRRDWLAGVEREKPWGYASKEGRLKAISSELDAIHKSLLILAKHIREKTEAQFLEVASADESVNKENAKKVLAQGIAILKRNERDVSDLADATASSPLEVSSTFDPKEQTLRIQLKNVSSSVVRMDRYSLRQPTVHLSTLKPNSWDAIQESHLLNEKHIKRTMNNVDLSDTSTSVLVLKPSEAFEIDYDLSEIIQDYSKRLPERSKRRMTSLYLELEGLTKNLNPIEGSEKQQVVEPARINVEFFIDEINAAVP